MGINKIKGSKIKEIDANKENKKLIEMLTMQQEMIKNLQKNINENENKFNKHIENYTKFIKHIENYTKLNDDFIILDKKFGFLENELQTNHGLKHSYYGYF